MNTYENSTYKIKISYIDKPATWHKLSNFLISFIIENNDITEDLKNGEFKNAK